MRLLFWHNGHSTNNRRSRKWRSETETKKNKGAQNHCNAIEIK
jgi:hypothetical protein